MESTPDRAHQERVAGLFPVVAALQRPFRIDQHIGDVLGVTDLPFAASDLEQGIVGRARRIGGIEEQHPPKPRPPAGGQGPVLALDIVDDGRTGPGQQCGYDKPDTLAAAGRRETEDVLGTIMTQIFGSPATEQNAIGA